METPEIIKSQLSTSDCSLDSLDSENELMQFVHMDELPVFEINSLSASPIELEVNETAKLENSDTLTNCNVNIINKLMPSNVADEHEMISLNVINSELEKNSCPSELKNLETIFEGVFLETPPKIKKYKNELIFHKNYSDQISKKTSLINESNKKPQ